MRDENAALKPWAIVVMGVSGAGKSTVARQIARLLDCDFIEGDELHPAPNVEKMSSGAPLTDADREPWLSRVGEATAKAVTAGQSVVVSCSALKRRYRDQLRAAVGPDLVFVHLDGAREVLLARLSERKGHFMPASLLDSQLASLEAPFDEADALVFDIALSPEEIAQAAVAALERIGRPKAVEATQ